METPDAIVVRPATPADAAVLGRLGAMLVAVHHGFDAERFIAPTPRTEQGYGGFLASQIAEPDSIVLVAEEAGAVIGYAYAGLEGMDYMILRGPAGVVYDLLVDPAQRRHGVGRRLMQAAVAALVQRGARQVQLSAASSNALAQRLFADLGFRPTMVEMTWEPPGATD